MENLFQAEVPMPNENILSNISSIAISFSPEHPDSEKIEEVVQTIQAHIDENEIALLDFIGNQMAKLSDDFADLIQATQDLFSAFSRLHNREDMIVSQKKESVIQNLKKLETSMALFRKI